MKNFLIVLAALLLLLGSFFLGRQNPGIISGQGTGNQMKVESVPDNSSIVADTDLAKASAGTSHKNNLPLPPSNQPLNDIFDDLRSRADAGDSKAACRLGLELIRCRQANIMSKVAAASLDDKEADKHDDIRPEDIRKQEDAMDRGRLGAMEKALSCNRITDDKIKLSTRYLRQAALASEPDAMLPYVDGLSLQGDEGLSMIRNPGFDDWRREALPVAERSLRMGIPEAAFMLTSAYSRDYSLFYGLVENDPVKAETMGLLESRLNGKPITGKTALDASDYQRAVSDSEKMFREYFHGEVQTRHKMLKKMSDLMDLRNDEVALCQ